jgi:motility quorum-sensing regulator/GCU-specific mRNA interferase toxin
VDKFKPTFDLEAFKAAFSTEDALNVTGSAPRDAAALGFGSTEIVEISHFYKCMTSYADHRVWQDVYHVPSDVGLLYVKFMADTVTEFLLLSFKEKQDG